MLTVKRIRCPMCDERFDAGDEAKHEHALPQSGELRRRWLESGLFWSEFHDIDEEARRWGHRDSFS